MIKNFFKTAWRNLWKNRFYSAINLAGLSIGLAVGIIILLWVKDELSFDRFHSHASQLYRVVSNIGDNNSRQTWGSVPAPISVYSKQEIPEVEDAVRIASNYDYAVYRYKDKEFNESKSAYVDPSFFSLFDFKLLNGNKAIPFPDNHSAVITLSTARKFFGNDDPIGKVIVADNKENFTIQGVLADFPHNSSLQYDMLFPIDILVNRYQPNEYWPSMNADWGNYFCLSFLKVHDQSKTGNIEKKLTQLHGTHNKHDKSSYYSLQPFTQMHLFSPDGSSSAMQMVKIFIVVAILLLLIACINYVNLSTARALLRAREVSVRKIVGAGKAQLFLQFIIETVILFTLATALAIGLIYLLMPLYNELSGKNNTFDIAAPQVWITIGCTIAGTVIASSIYPALLLSSFKPILALKGKLNLGIGNTRFRQVLVVTQFSFSVLLIIGTLVIGRQMRYIHDKDLGFDKSHTFTLNMRDMQPHYNAIRAELLNQPGITGITSASGNIVAYGSTTGDTDWEGKDPNSMFIVNPMAIDEHFISQMKLELAAGEGFRGGDADSANIILNETAVRESGIKDPVGKWFSLWNTKCRIIGVAKDYHFTSMKYKIEPAVFYYKKANPTLYVKTTGKDAAGAIAAVEKRWKQYNAGFPFKYQFMDDRFDAMYRSDRQTNTLFNVFAGIAIVISCLGLFGLATYTVQVKTREIGIRKVLGASVAHVTGLLARDFIKLVLIAIVIASPIAWLTMNSWLQHFEYRTSIGVTVFIIAGFIALLIAIATVSSQAIKAALTNPVKSLKSE